MVKRIIKLLIEVAVLFFMVFVIFMVFRKYINSLDHGSFSRYTGSVTDIFVEFSQNNKTKQVKKEFEDFYFDKTKITNAGENAKSIPILLYHGINEKSTNSDPSYESFKEHLFTLKKAGYNTITLNELSGFLNNSITLPDRSILITFDDGIVSSFYNTDPILEALDFNALIFVITKYSLENGSNYYLSRHELVKMITTSRWEIQPHAHDSHELQVINENGEYGHFLSNKIWNESEKRLESNDEFRDRIHNEFVTVKQLLKEKLNIDSYVFAFPFGDFGQSSINFSGSSEIVLSEVGNMFDLATIYQFWPTRGFTHNFPTPNGPMIKRLNVLPEWSGQDLLEVIERGREKKLPYFIDLLGIENWIVSWGKLTTEKGEYILSTTDETTSAQIILDGSYLWENYEAVVSVDEINTDDLSLLARVEDTDNYVSCSFGENGITIKNISDGNENFEKKIGNRYGSLLPGTYKIKVSDRSVECLFNEISLVKSDVPGVRLNGGFGLKIWDKLKNNASISFEGINVAKIEK